MPHLIIEYSANLRDDLGPESFVELVHRAAEATGEFPSGSLRTRTEERPVYRVGNGDPQNGFVHIVLRVRPRSPERKREMGEHIFAVIRDFTDRHFTGRPIGVTFEIQEIDVAFRHLKNYWDAVKT